MKAGSITVAIYALILLAGGIVGYLKANSLPSIILSASSALVLALCAYNGLKGKFGWVLTAALIMIVLNFFFIYRLFVTHKFMPAGMMAVVTTLFGIPLLTILKKEVSDIKLD